MNRDAGPGLEEVLAALARDHGFQVRHCEPLPGGAVNRSWRLATSDGDLVLRLAADRDQELIVDRRSEFAALDAAAAAGLAPRLIACDPARGVLLTRFEPPGPWTRAQARAPQGIGAVAHWFAALHRLAPPAACRVVDVRATCAAYLAELAARPGGVGGLSRLLREAEAAGAALGPPRPVVLCHNDLHHLNLVGPVDAPRAVDWEYAGRGDGRLDLAQYALAHDLDAAARAVLLGAYAGPDGPVTPAELEAAMRLAGAVNDAWAAVVAGPAG